MREARLAGIICECRSDRGGGQWVVDFSDGTMYGNDYKGNYCYVRAVRGGS